MWRETKAHTSSIVWWWLGLTWLLPVQLEGASSWSGQRKVEGFRLTSQSLELKSTDYKSNKSLVENRSLQLKNRCKLSCPVLTVWHCGKVSARVHLKQNELLRKGLRFIAWCWFAGVYPGSVWGSERRQAKWKVTDCSAGQCPTHRPAAGGCSTGYSLHVPPSHLQCQPFLHRGQRHAHYVHSKDQITDSVIPSDWYFSPYQNRLLFNLI